MSFDSITMRCFIAVAETASFTRAAERVARTQLPAWSNWWAKPW